MSTGKSLHQVIDDAAEGMQFGTVHLTIKKNRDMITTVDTTKISQRKVSGNAQALTLIGSMLKLLAQAGETGNLTFTITLQKGEAQQLLTHDFRRDNLDLQSGEYK